MAPSFLLFLFPSSPLTPKEKMSEKHLDSYTLSKLKDRTQNSNYVSERLC